ncbi:TPA_asm: orphan protein [Human alphaherpesvirus 1]|nr:TPA_asm: orphan protein [Human alphaherpesvirus 1]
MAARRAHASRASGCSATRAARAIGSMSMLASATRRAARGAAGGPHDALSTFTTSPVRGSEPIRSGANRATGPVWRSRAARTHAYSARHRVGFSRGSSGEAAGVVAARAAATTAWTETSAEP